MKCLVCGKEYEAAECPRCHFPDVQIVGDQKQALAAMMPTIEKFRANFMNTVNISLEIYYWKDKNGQVVLDRREEVPVGTVKALRQGETWVERKFARIADQEQIPVTILVDMGEGKHSVSISVPNLKKAELQQLGVTMDERYNLQLLLRNETEQPTKSKPYALLDL